ncbi:MAG TPA: hypothetical protein VJP85_14170 [Candidatus Baltobacteraceae bacterium]|nr:hypothetical protein [Candidatus Baltobacteraceae bacterium]
MLTYGIILNVAAPETWELQCIERLHQSKLGRLRHVVCAASGADARKILDLAPGAQVCDTAAAAAGGTVDFFLLFGDTGAAAPLVDAARYGVWYFALSDLTRFSTAAPGFWEVRDGEDVTGAFLLRLGDDGGPGIALKSGYLPTIRQSFERNLESLLDAVTMWPQHVCWDILHGAASYFDAPPMPPPPLHRGVPSAIDRARMRVRERQSRAASFVREKFYSIEWTIARVNETPAQFIGGERRADVTYLYRSTKERYLADPCVIVRDARAFVFCEEYRKADRLGTVMVSELGKRGASAPQAVITEAHHLSYPHVFEHGGETYCIPESGGIRKVCLYRCVEFPATWEYVHTLIDGFEAADSTIVRHADRWWLFCTSSREAVKGHYSHLYVWHANDLFGTWTQHVRNPVKIDARSARPAGPFFTHEGQLYRPAQDCSRSYGCAVRINRIDTLTPTDFAEIVVGTIRPPIGRYTRGLHTLCAAADGCVVDVERYAFDPENARYACTQTLKRALLRAGISQESLAWMKRRTTTREAAVMRTAQPSKVE